MKPISEAPSARTAALRLSIIALVVLGLIVGLCAHFYSRDTVALRIAHAKTLAAVIGAHSIDTLDNLEPRRVERSLSAIVSEPGFLGAFIHRKDGRLFVQRHSTAARSASLRFSARPLSPDIYPTSTEGYWRDGSGIHVYASIKPDGEPLGTVHLVYDARILGFALSQLIAVGSAALLGMLTIWFAVWSTLRRVLRPGKELEQIAREVCATGNYQTPIESARSGALAGLACALHALLERAAHDTARTSSDQTGMHESIAADDASRRGALELDRVTTELQSLQQEFAELNDKAEVTARVKTQFLANMSHEIRTPMNGILGMTELLLGTHLSDKQRRFADTVRRSAEALLHIVNDILDFSKMEAGKLMLESVEFDLRETVEEVAELLAEKAQSKNIELACHIPDDLGVNVVGDPGRLRQVLTNIIGNAIKFTDTGEVLVRVSAPQQDGGKVTYRFEVTDTGIGMTAETQARIFESFSQADGSTTRRFGGAGLGLTISKELVSLMGGMIRVHSKLGEGSRFEFTATFQTSDALAPADTQVDSRLCDLKVLCVDDNETNRSILSHQLARWDVTHDCAESGERALEFLREAARTGQAYDIAVLDMHMPGMDGLELARAVKSDSNISAVQLTLLTSAVLEIGAEEMREAGIVQFISKPARQSQLYNTLLTMARSREGRPGPIRYEDNVEPVNGHTLNARVLLAEDNPVNQEVAVNMLELFGCKVEVVDNGRLALERLGQSPFDVVLMDCQMPEMDGFEATAAIRRLEQDGASKRTPIIALTANALEGDRERCLAADMDDYVSKPFKQEQLRVCLQRWVEHAGGSSVAQASEDECDQPIDADADVGAAHPKLDENALNNIRALQRPGKPDILSKVITIYLEKSPSLIATLAQAIASEDAAAVHMAAHTLKSSSANLGAHELAAVCKELETAGRDRDLSRAADLLARVEQEYEGSAAELETHCESAPAIA